MTALKTAALVALLALSAVDVAAQNRGWSAQGALGGSAASERTVTGQGVQRRTQAQGALGGTATVERQVGPGGVQSTIQGSGPMGGSYTCSRGVAYDGAGNRVGGANCTGPGGNTWGGGSTFQRNADGSVSGTVTGPLGGRVQVEGSR